MNKLFLVLIAAIFTACTVQAQQILIDDFDAGCRLIGVWADNKSNGYSGAGTVGGVYHYTSTHDPFKKTGREQVIWTPTIKKAGNYKVEVSFRGSGNRSSKVSYEVVYSGGSKKMTISQRTDGMTWEKLGTFPFDAGSGGFVRLKSDGGGSASADAARFTYVGPSGNTQGNQTGNTTPGTAPANTSLTNLINAGPTAKVSNVLDSSNPGTAEYTFSTGGTVSVTPYLTTYGPASLSAVITKSDGTVVNWISWSRSSDKDGSLLEVDGLPVAASMSSSKPGDWTPANPSAYSCKLGKGDKITVTLKGSFGSAPASLKTEISEPNPGTFNGGTSGATPATAGSTATTPAAGTTNGGLYKPESKLWLLPLGIRAEQVGEAGEYIDSACTRRVKYLVWPRINGTGSGQPVCRTTPIDTTQADLYHNNRLKLREAMVSANGHTLGCFDKNGNLLVRLTVIDRNKRQE